MRNSLTFSACLITFVLLPWQPVQASSHTADLCELLTVLTARVPPDCLDVAGLTWPQREQAAAALGRLTHAEAHGDRRAHAALEAIRQDNDPAPMFELLAAQIQQNPDEAIELHRQRATLAQFSGALDVASSSLNAILIASPNDLRAIDGLADIARQHGELDEAERGYRRLLELAPNDKHEQTAAHCNLGLIMDERGDKEASRAMYCDAMDINALSCSECTACDFTNLGITLQSQGSLDEAEAMYRKALELSEILHTDYVAYISNKLGGVMRFRGDLDGAEAMHRSALQINEQLRRLHSMGVNYCNLGNVIAARGDLDEAEALYIRSLDIAIQLHRHESVAINYCNLGIVMQLRGKLDESEALHRKALQINEQIDSVQGMATNYTNLGAVMQDRGNYAAARTFWTTALDLSKSIEDQDQINKVQCMLDGLPTPE